MMPNSNFCDEIMHKFCVFSNVFEAFSDIKDSSGLQYSINTYLVEKFHNTDIVGFISDVVFQQLIYCTF